MGRVYESNGPDVKVRGTAQHVADKYMQLARDAHSSGDRVMAESYYQYAEHYLRLLASTQGYPNQGGQQQQQRRPGDDGYDDGDEMDGDYEQQQQSAPASSPQQQSHSGAGNGEAEPQPAATAAEQTGETGEDSTDGEQPWGGPEPEFLRRGPANGATRSRRPRNSRGQGPRAKGDEETEPTGGDTPEQAN